MEKELKYKMDVRYKIKLTKFRLYINIFLVKTGRYRFINKIEGANSVI